MILPRLLQAWKWVCGILFGTFETEELKKFTRMGVIFAGIIGSYWTLRVLKDTVFNSLVGLKYQWLAKLISPLALVPIIVLYTRLVEKKSREEVFYTLARIYGGLTLFFGLTILWMQAPAADIAARTGLMMYLTKVYGFAWYVFIESYGSLVVALFWAIASDITSPDSAKRGFPYVTMIGQFGGIVMPLVINSLPHWFAYKTSSLSVTVCGIATLGLMFLMRNLFVKTPRSLMVSFHGKNEATVEKEQEPGFFEGLRLLVTHKYLLGIFATLFLFEFLVTIFDYNFKLLASERFLDDAVGLQRYLSNYAGAVNFVALVCLLLGVSNITRYLGISVALALMPVLFGGAVFGFITLDSLSFLFALMVGVKAINYALNGPALKQLYIPTTHDVRFKSQAWIETFGSRGSKGAGSSMNSLLPILRAQYGAVAGRAHYIALTGYIGFAMVVGWFFIALFLGRTYNKAIDSKSVVC